MVERRRNKGSGSVCQRADGRWVAMVDLGTVDGKRKRRTFYGLTRDEAETKMRAAFPNLPDDDPRRPRRARTEAMWAARALGTHTRAEWFAKVRAFGNVCYYCGGKDPGRLLQKEHLTPVSRGGSDAIDNLVPACRRCNEEKGDMDEAGYIMWRGLPYAHQAI